MRIQYIWSVPQKVEVILRSCRGQEQYAGQSGRPTQEIGRGNGNSQSGVPFGAQQISYRVRFSPDTESFKDPDSGGTEIHSNGRNYRHRIQSKFSAHNGRF